MAREGQGAGCEVAAGNFDDGQAPTPATSLPASTWPGTPLTPGPASCRRLTRLAPAMTGVASRNANRAAPWWDRPRHSPATVTPERLTPGKQRADQGAADEYALGSGLPGQAGSEAVARVRVVAAAGGHAPGRSRRGG
jgi:hypothetical protein